MITRYPWIPPISALCSCTPFRRKAEQVMQQIITAKLKLLTIPEQHHSLRQTQLAYRDALNSVSRYAFEHGKTSSQQALQRALYDEIRVRYKLPAQMACNVPRQ